MPKPQKKLKICRKPSSFTPKLFPQHYLLRVVCVLKIFSFLPIFCCMNIHHSPFVSSVYTQPTRSYLKQTNLNFLNKSCKLNSKSVTIRRNGCLPYCNIHCQNYALSSNCYQALYNFHLILSRRTFDSYMSKPSPLDIIMHLTYELMFAY